MAIQDDLLNLCPQFSGDTRVPYIVGMATARVNRRIWGSKADMATVLMAAHILTRFPATGPVMGGTVTMEKVGDLQTQYAQIEMKGDEELATTAYGAQFAQMRKALGVTLSINAPDGCGI